MTNETKVETSIAVRELTLAPHFMNRRFHLRGLVFAFSLFSAIVCAAAQYDVSPSGKTDGTDSDNIRAAIANAIGEGGSGKVTFADGTYYVTNTIALNAAVELVGNDADRSQVKIDAMNVSYVGLVEVNHAQAFVHGFRFQNAYLGPNGVGGSSYVYGPVYITAGVVSNCTVKMSKASRFNGGVGMTGGTIVDCDITGCGSTDGGAARIGGALRMGGASCVADGLVITNNTDGKAGAGVYLKTSGARLINSTIASNSAGTDAGGGIYAETGTIVSNCVIRGNTGGSGAGYCGTGKVYDSLIVDNVSSASGGGVNKWGADSVLDGCTVASNSAYAAGAGVYQSAGSIRDCVIWNNGTTVFQTQEDSLRLVGGTCTYTCAAQAGSGEGNVANKYPVYVDAANGDYRLAPASPCIGTASDGGDMGYYPATATTGTRASFEMTIVDGKAPATSSFKAVVSGATPTVYTWDFGDGKTDTTSGATVTHEYTNPGRYTIKLTVATDKGNLTYTMENAVNLGATTVYVNRNGSNTFPFATEETGATDIPTAVKSVISSDAQPGKVRFVDGTYPISSEIVLDGPIELIGNDANRENVVINGQNATGYLIYLRYSKALVHGFRFQGASGGTADGVYYHGPVTITGGILSNCTVWIEKQCRYHGGVGMNGGTIVDCLIRGSSSGDGGSARIGTALRMNASSCVADRVIVTNTTSAAGAGVALNASGSQLLNSIVVDNSAGTDFGGGIYGVSGSIVSNCVVRDNKAGSGAGYSGAGNIYETTFIGNVATSSGGGVSMSGGTVTGCVFSACTAGTYGGGICKSNGTVDHSTIVRCNAQSTGSGIYQTAGSVKNTIAFENGNVTGYSGSDIVSTAGTVTYSRGREYLNKAGGPDSNGNIGEAPLFRDIETLDLRLFSSSPCRGAAENGTDMGAVPYVYDPEEPVGIIITVSADRECYPVTATYGCEITGSLEIDKYVWDFGDGTSEEVATNGIIHVYANPGVYSATLILKLKNGDEKVASKENAVSVYSDVAWADAANPNPEAPYDTPAKAANTLAEALSAVYVPVGGYGTVRAKAGRYLHAADTTYKMARAVRLVSDSGKRDVIVDGCGKHLKFQVQNADVVMSGIVVSNAVGFSNLYGVYDITSGTVTNCAAIAIASDYNDSAYAGGANVSGSSSLLTDSYFENCNTSDGGYGGENCIGGIYITSGGVVENCVVTNCFGNNAGGVLMKGGILRGTTIAGCRKSSALNLYAGGTVESCRIVNNRADGGCAGVIVRNTSTLRNSLVAGNTSTAVSAGIQINGGDAVIENCTVADNVGKTYAGIVGGAAATWVNTLSWGNLNAAGAANPDLVTLGTFNSCLVGTDPHFKKVKGMAYHVTTDSPARDNGVVLDWMEGATDLQGNPRILNHGPDIGCYEDQSTGLLLIVR